MIVSRITAKSQTTIPRAVRAALGVKPGDDIGYEIDGMVVTITRARRDAADPFQSNFSAFSEWSDSLDRAYDGD